MKMKQQRNVIGGGELSQRTKHLKSAKYTKQKGEINYKLISVRKRKKFKQIMGNCHTWINT